MVNDEALINILEAADSEDIEDLRIRFLLITALRESSYDYTALQRRTNPERHNHHSPSAA